MNQPSSKRRSTSAVVPGPVRFASKSDQVKDLQVFLSDDGHYTRSIDGYYGNYTRNAVYALQKVLLADGHAVPLNGHYGQETVDALGGATGAASAAEPSREELYERAQELDVKGRSTMDKDELAEAVEEAEGNTPAS